MTSEAKPLAAAPAPPNTGPTAAPAPTPATAPLAAFGPGSVTVPPPGDPATFPALQAEIRQLAREHNAVILAHSYERAEIQDVADHVGDSLRLSRVAASAPESTIVFCGVKFMAETAKILSPDKRVLLPDNKAGCSLADSITVEQLRAWKAEHRGAVVVSYVNTTAAVKAESDYCCTSSNARAVIDAIPADRQILFLPDMFLGLWLQRVTGRKLTIWLGECHVHAGIRPADVEQLRREVPGAELLVHPECGCTSQVLEAAGDDVHILSTEGMVTYAQGSKADTFLIATETGILHRLEQKAPGKRFVPVNREAVCQYMKLTTLEKLRDSLRLGVYEIDVPVDIAARARLALERMIAIS
jgi:quinolinate synthase